MFANGGMSGFLFLMSAVLVSVLLLGLIVGTECMLHANPTTNNQYYSSTTTYWVYASIAFAIAVVMLLVLLYLAYLWSCACGKPPACPPTRRQRSSNSCPPSACY